MHVIIESDTMVCGPPKSSRVLRAPHLAELPAVDNGWFIAGSKEPQSLIL